MRVEGNRTAYFTAAHGGNGDNSPCNLKLNVF